MNFNQLKKIKTIKEKIFKLKIDNENIFKEINLLDEDVEIKNFEMDTLSSIIKIFKKTSSIIVDNDFGKNLVSENKEREKIENELLCDIEKNIFYIEKLEDKIQKNNYYIGVYNKQIKSFNKK